ncbi:unnamed protein product [Effrenium voratum]|nr:unnamed protein product [Effrenium voratum]
MPGQWLHGVQQVHVPGLQRRVRGALPRRLLRPRHRGAGTSVRALLGFSWPVLEHELRAGVWGEHLPGPLEEHHLCADLPRWLLWVGRRKQGEGGPKIGGTCEKCLGTCKKCSSSVVCEVCWDGTFLNPRTGRCAMECPSDHYMVGFGVEGRICKPCPLEAAGCVNETWFFECRGDNQYLAVGGGTCTTKCPDGYFGRPGVQLEEDGPLIGGTCEKCVGNCQRCKSAKECLQCKGGTYFDPISFKCSFECPSDHFMVGIGDVGRECKPCPQLFGACVNETFATQCRGDQQYLVPAGGACSSSCPAGFFGRPGVVMSEEEPLIGGTCEQCIAPCETCFSATECKTCKGGTYLNPYDHGCRFDCPPDTFMSGTGEPTDGLASFAPAPSTRA